MPSGSPYERTQRSPLIVFVLGPVLFAGAFFLTEALEPGVILVGLVGLVALVLVDFWSLTVRVDEDAVNLRFGIGLIQRTVALERIEAAARVRNRWWYGWGIRLTPHGWLWNVAGLDAVELRLRNGKVFRIGTDDPTGLQTALEAALEARLSEEVGDAAPRISVSTGDPDRA